MICPNCGNPMSPITNQCAFCEERKSMQHTKKLPDLRTMHTQHLVRLDTCPNCRTMLFPGYATCPGCGASVNQGMAAKPSAGATWRVRVLTGLAVCAVLIVFVWILMQLRQG